MSPFSSPISPVIQSELAEGERVLWAGQPDPSYMVRRARKSAIQGAVALVVMLALTWGLSAPLHAGQPPDYVSILILVPGFGLIGVAVALYMIDLPRRERALARRTFYALTDRRALIVTKQMPPLVESVAASELKVSCYPIVGRLNDVSLKWERRGYGRGAFFAQIGFFGIANAGEVADLARQIAP